jgi:hypothetical protein
MDVPFIAKEQQTATGGSKLMLVVVALFVVFGGLLVVVGGGAAAYFISDQLGAPENTVPTGPAPAPQLVTVVGGGKVVSPDSRPDIKSIPTLLKYGDPVGGSVIVTGAGGFRAEWDGKSPFDIGGLADGRYATMITPTLGSKIRGKSFQVVTGKKSCEFEFDVASKSWTGGCK